MSAIAGGLYKDLKGELVVAEFDAQQDRAVSADASLTREQIAADELDLGDGLVRLAAMVAAGQSLDDSLTEVAGFAAHAIPGVDGAGVTLIHPVGATMDVAAWAVTAPFVREIDILQYEVLHEGPCITCMQQRVAQVSGSLGGDRRWPRFGPRMGRMGVASAMALPLLIADQVVGSVNCYAREPDAFGEHAVRLGTAFAAPAAVAVYNAQVLAGARDTAAHLQRALVSSKEIDQAIGIIRARAGGTAEEAFDRLRRISQSEHIKLHEVARRILADAVRRADARHPPPDPAP